MENRAIWTDLDTNEWYIVQYDELGTILGIAGPIEHDNAPATIAELWAAEIDRDADTIRSNKYHRWAARPIISTDTMTDDTDTDVMRVLDAMRVTAGQLRHAASTQSQDTQDDDPNVDVYMNGWNDAMNAAADVIEEAIKDALNTSAATIEEIMKSVAVGK